MANKNFLAGILAIALVLGMTVVGCDNGSTSSGSGGGDTWSNVTSLSQLDGTWKGSFSETITMKELIESEGGEWDDSMETTLGSDMRVTMTTEMTQTINASAKTVSGSQKTTFAFSGSKIADVWEIIKQNASGYADGFEADDTKYTLSETYSAPDETMTDDEISDMLSSGLQINQNGTKINLPAGIMGEGSPELIFTKQ